jgi:predicted dehydrogenase
VRLYLDRIKVAILGCGRMGLRHAEAYNRNTKVEIAGFYDERENLASDLAKKFHTKKYDSIDSVMKDTKTNALSICTPNAMHYDLLKKAIEHEKNILVEKPIVTTLEHCRSIMSMMKKSSSKVMVGHTHRFYPCNIALKSVLDSGKIGIPKIINTFDYIPGKNPGQKMPQWMKIRKSSGGGVFMTDLIHTVDKISWLMNSSITKVFAPMISNFIEKRDVEDAGVAILWLKNGAIATCTHGCPSPGAIDMSIKVIGINGEVNMEFGKNLDVRKNTISHIPFMHKGDLPMHNSIAFHDEINEFVSSILRNRQSKITYKDGIQAVNVVLSLYESFRKKRPIIVKPLA